MEEQELKLFEKHGDASGDKVKDYCEDGLCNAEDGLVDGNDKDSASLEDNTSPYSDTSSSQERETWGSTLDFILSLLGYSVGLGNLWRFPYLCMRNGGGAFLIPFLLCLLTCGLPLFFLEVCLGQFLGKSMLHAWVMCPLFKGIGVGMVIVSAVMTLYYNVIIAWSMYYLVNSFVSPVPWSTCDGWWNTDNCFVKKSMSNLSTQAGNVTIISNLSTAVVGNTSELMSSEEEYWQYNVLQISKGLHDFGSMPWHMPVALFAAWTLVFFCIMKGVRTIGKVVYVTALLPYVLLLTFFIKGLTLEGASDGILYYLRPDLSKMMKGTVWIEAAIQMFYSLGPGWGQLITMASYNKFNNNCLRDTILVCCFGEGTSIFCGLVVFTILGYISHELGLPIEKVVKSGPGLGFVAYPQALARLPAPQLWAVLFFLMLIIVGLDSEFAYAESVIAGVIECFPRLRKRRLPLSLLACIMFFAMGVPLFCFQGGMYMFQLIDWYVGTLALPVLCFLECLVVGWIYGTERFSRDIELMLGRGVPMVFRICWCIITPVVVLCCLVFILSTYKPPVYGDYHYPGWTQAIGWIVASLPIIPLPVCAVLELLKHRHSSFRMRLMSALRPSSDWKPNSKILQVDYSSLANSPYGSSLVRRMKLNVFGR